MVWGLHSAALARVIRLLHYLVIAAGPLVFSLIFWFDSTPPLESEGVDLWHAALAGYLLGVLDCGFWSCAGGNTVATVPARPCSRKQCTHMIDVAARLGYKPAGRGKDSLMARLPGNEIFQVDLSEKTLSLPRLPAAWDGLTILHLSDLHLHGTPDRSSSTR